MIGRHPARGYRSRAGLNVMWMSAEVRLGGHQGGLRLAARLGVVVEDDVKSEPLACSYTIGPMALFNPVVTAGTLLWALVDREGETDALRYANYFGPRLRARALLREHELPAVKRGFVT